MAALIPDNQSSDVSSEHTRGADAQAAPSSRLAAKPRWRVWLNRQYKLILIGMLLYVLSIGPMFWHWYAAVYLNGNPWVELFYRPLLLLTTLPLFRDLINWWIIFWNT